MNHTEEQTATEGCTNDPSAVRVDRRTCLTIAATALSTAGIVGRGSRTATAISSGFGTDGYGAGAFGDPSSDSAPTITTRDATGVDASSATLAGELSDLGGASSAAVYFEWGLTDDGLTSATASQTLESAGTFSHTVTGLESGAEYTFRAVADASDGETAVGTTRTVTTDTVSTAPTIDRFGVSEAGKPDPHATISVHWRVSDGNGDLRQVAIEIRDPDGRLVESAVRTVDGATGTGSEEFDVKHGGGTVYDVALRVDDEAGNETHQATSVHA